MDPGLIAAFAVYLVGMLVIGILCYRLTDSLSGYMLGGRQLNPGVAALSAGASDMSGWLLLGLPGAVYVGGLSQAWIAVGLTIGAYLNWQFVAKRLRVYTEVADDAITIPDFLSSRFQDRSGLLRIVSAVVILLFFTFYVSAGLVAGGILFQETFGIGYSTALWAGALVIVSYTLIGGFLAVSWTDFVQGSLMFAALVVVPIVALAQMGGAGETVARVGEIDVSLNDMFTDMTVLGIVSLMAWGLGYFGQPQILVRFMAVRRARDVPLARLINMVWMVIALYGAILVGYCGIAFFSDQPLANPETVFIEFCRLLFNPWIAGILLAAILAAVMSTIDSQLLVCSSALTEDFYRAFLRKNASQRELVTIGRASVIAIAVIAAILAEDAHTSVLDLVGYAWAGLGAAFGPIILIALYWRAMTRNAAAIGMIVGAVTVVVWKQLSGGLFDIYELLPGFVLNAVAVAVVSRLETRPKGRVGELFERTVEALRKSSETETQAR
ncbi:MAG: sodium/proline symporter PutP [Pseudomonadota bacterium]